MTFLSIEYLEAIDTLLHQVYLDEQLPGISTTASHRQEVVWARSYGFPDLDRKETADSETVYHLGLVTKIFTALMLMRLRDAGKLRLEDPTDKYLPEVRVTGHPPITLKQLASHTSGLPMTPRLKRYRKQCKNFPRVWKP